MSAAKSKAMGTVAGAWRESKYREGHSCRSRISQGYFTKVPAWPFIKARNIWISNVALSQYISWWVAPACNYCIVTTMRLRTSTWGHCDAFPTKGSKLRPNYAYVAIKIFFNNSILDSPLLKCFMDISLVFSTREVSSVIAFIKEVIWTTHIPTVSLSWNKLHIWKYDLLNSVVSMNYWTLFTFNN